MGEQAIKALGRIRLACRTCERDDFDGTTRAAALAAGWTDVGEVQSLERSMAPMEETGDSCWWTHLGDCPGCRAAEGAGS